MASSQVFDLIIGLKSRNTETRHKALRELLHFAKTDLREMSQDALKQTLDDFNQHIHALTSGFDNYEKRAGILVIVCLISGENDINKTRITRYAQYLRNIFPSNDTNILELASKAMGRIAASYGIKRSEYVENEMTRAYDWLSEDRNESKRLSACYMLKELAISMPTYFFQHINDFFNHIKVALRDPKEQVREAGAKALRAAFVVTIQRELPGQLHKALWYAQCYEEALTSFSDHAPRECGLNRDDSVHGALLILNELLRCSNAQWEKEYTILMQKLDSKQDIADEMTTFHTSNYSWSYQKYSEEKQLNVATYESAKCRQLIIEKYDKISSDVMAQQISRSHSVHQMLLLIIPRLAAFNTEAFAKKHLKSTINHLITFLRGREKEKAIAFTTLGLICVAVGYEMQQYLNRIIEIIKLTLPPKDFTKKRDGMESPLFTCITLLGFAMKENVATEIKELLDPMCTTGLTPQLTTCFKELSQNIPSIKKDITDRLLNILSLILRKKPYLSQSVESHTGYSSSALIEPHDAIKLVLALRTLGSFDFEWNNTLMSFIRRCTDHYLQSEQHDIRLESIKTIAKLLIKAIERTLQCNSRTLNIIVDESIGKLLSVGRSDFDQEIRYKVLEIFINPIFDKFLASEEHLSCLFVAVNDSSSDIGGLALCIVGRLSNLNPSYTTPGLRQLFVQILMELQYSESARSKEQSLKMINNIISHAPRLTRQLVDTILKILVPKLRDKDSNSAMICTTLKAIGDLAEVNGGGNALQEWLSELTSIQVEILSDPNQSEKRSVALWSFGQVISAVGYVVTPYMEYPNLMDLLLSFLKTEQQPRDRRETIRVLGLLGALDPYKHKVNQGLIDFQTVSTLIPIDGNTPTYENFDANTSEMLVNMSPLVLDEFYPAITVVSLMRILRDPALSQHHISVVHSVTYIFQTLGIKCVPYISRVTPSLLYVIRTTDDESFREFLFTQLAQLISVVKIHIREYLEDIFELIREYWTQDSPLQPTLILLIEHITVAIGTEFKVYLRKILPNILRVLKHDVSKDRFLTEKLLMAIQKFENNLDDVLMSVIPAVTSLLDGRNIPMSVSKLAMETIEHLSMYLYLRPYSAILIQALAKVLENNPTLRQVAMNTLCALVVQLGRDYIDYIPSIDRILLKHKIHSSNYIVLITRLQGISTLASDDDYMDETRIRLRNLKTDVVPTSDMQSMHKLALNVQNLRKYFSVHNLISKEDWLEWLRQLSIGLLNESNSPAIRACASLAQIYTPLASDLFNAAFMSCWTELKEQQRLELVGALEQALTVPDAPELALVILNLAEFFEHCEKGTLPISIKLLGDTAISCRAYAKALYYKEEEYRRNQSTHVIEALIHINNKLQQKESANGLLEKVISQQKTDDSLLIVHVRWYEKLHNWEQALELYDKKLELKPQDCESKLGMMRCLEAMGEWRKLFNLCDSSENNETSEIRKKSSKIAAAAAWGLQEWDSMKKHVECISENTLDGSLYRAILSIHDGHWSESRHYIDSARSILDVELTAVVGESYQRAYATLVNAQLLTELEEVVTYKLVEERRGVIYKSWCSRLQGGERLVEDWRKILQVRSLVMTPQEDFQTWLKFASLCRKTGAINQSHKIVLSILGSDPITNPDVLLRVQDPRIILSYCKNLWDVGNKRYAHDILQRFVESSEPGNEEQCKLLARCHLKLGSWCEMLHEVNEDSIPDILRNYAAAIFLAPEWYKACHAWACMNFETVLFYKQQDNLSDSSIAGASGDKKVSRIEFINTYTIPAIEGFFKSISLSNGSALQDTLRLLTLWFDHGHYPAIYDALFEGIRQIDVKIWLQVIPQLIARIDSPRSLVAKLVHILLIDIGKLHPQALVYPLTVATKSSFVTRKTAANYILKTMSTHSQKLVSEAAIISEELIKVAMLWHDQVYTALEDASRLYFSEKDYRGMFRTLEKMHAMLDRPPETLKEVSFLQMYGRDLQEAQRWCELYKETNDDRYMNSAWEVYCTVVRRIGGQFRAHTALELQYVSRRLHAARDLQLAVPGSYVPHHPLIRITSINTHLQVIKSKQRPRRLTIQGSDGKQYMFLLKGHEDLRQDERVMQLFGLVNTLLRSAPTTYRRDLAIQRYAVVPLSPNSGLIGWVPHCDTLYNLISDYRDKKSNKMALNTEQQIMLRMSTDYQKLMLKQKVEVFEYTLSQTPGNDLARLLWLKSPSAEAWFERRTNYTRSLAVMSMVGYILGLGDRHPSNIMLHRVTGKVLHIDFGDCFEVTQTRERFPEKIPFRLTRMLIKAMEVTGIEGTFRSTCESVMEVLHNHKDSVMAVLEAFVYDPLLNWRLIDNERRSASESSFSSDMDSPYSLPSRSRTRLHYESVEMPPESNLNKRALAILNRIRDKLTGRDFPNACAGEDAGAHASEHANEHAPCVTVPQQVQLLLDIATDNENLCQCYIGWCPFW